MDYETQMILHTAMNAISMLASLVLAMAALIVAIMLTMRKQGVIGGWILALAAGGTWVVDLAFLVSGFAFSEGRGGMGVLWLYVALRVVNLVLLCAIALAFFLMKPAAAATAGTEVAHG